MVVKDSMIQFLSAIFSLLLALANINSLSMDVDLFLTTDEVGISQKKEAIHQRILAELQSDKNTFHKFYNSFLYCPPLHTALYAEWHDLTQLMLEQGVSLKQKDCMGNTPLHIASKRTPIDTLRTLLQCVMRQYTNLEDLNALYSIRNNKNRTPFHCAIHHFNINAAKLLISFGAEQRSEDLFEIALCAKLWDRCGRLPEMIAFLRQRDLPISPRALDAVHQIKFDVNDFKAQLSLAKAKIEIKKHLKNHLLPFAKNHHLFFNYIPREIFQMALGYLLEDEI